MWARHDACRSQRGSEASRAEVGQPLRTSDGRHCISCHRLAIDCWWTARLTIVGATELGGAVVANRRAGLRLLRSAGRRWEHSAAGAAASAI